MGTLLKVDVFSDIFVDELVASLISSRRSSIVDTPKWTALPLVVVDKIASFVVNEQPAALNPLEYRLVSRRWDDAVRNCLRLFCVVRIESAHQVGFRIVNYESGAVLRRKSLGIDELINEFSSMPPSLLRRVLAILIVSVSCEFIDMLLQLLPLFTHNCELAIEVHDYPSHIVPFPFKPDESMASQFPNVRLRALNWFNLRDGVNVDEVLRYFIEGQSTLSDLTINGIGHCSLSPEQEQMLRDVDVEETMLQFQTATVAFGQRFRYLESLALYLSEERISFVALTALDHLTDVHVYASFSSEESVGAVLSADRTDFPVLPQLKFLGIYVQTRYLEPTTLLVNLFLLLPEHDVNLYLEVDKEAMIDVLTLGADEGLLRNVVKLQVEIDSSYLLRLFRTWLISERDGERRMPDLRVLHVRTKQGVDSVFPMPHSLEINPCPTDLLVACPANVERVRLTHPLPQCVPEQALARVSWPLRLLFGDGKKQLDDRRWQIDSFLQAGVAADIDTITGVISCVTLTRCVVDDTSYKWEVAELSLAEMTETIRSMRDRVKQLVHKRYPTTEVGYREATKTSGRTGDLCWKALFEWMADGSPPRRRQLRIIVEKGESVYTRLNAFECF